MYEEDRDALTAQFDAAEVLLKEIQAERQAVRESVEAQRVKVDQATEDVESAVKEMRDGEFKMRDDMREIREEINSIREMLPKVRILWMSGRSSFTNSVVQMIEKNKESQSHSLAELQQELKSLKALLLSRNPSFPSSTSPVPSLPAFAATRPPSIPSWQLAGGSSLPQNGLVGDSSSMNGGGLMSSISTPNPVPVMGSSSSFALDGPASQSSSNLNVDPLSQPESM